MYVCMHAYMDWPPTHAHSPIYGDPPPPMVGCMGWLVDGWVDLWGYVIWFCLQIWLFDNGHVMHNCQFWTFFWHLYIWFLTSALYRAVFILCSKFAIIQHNHFISHSWHVIASINHFKLYLLVLFYSFLKQVATQRSQIVRKLPKMWITVCNC